MVTILLIEDNHIDAFIAQKALVLGGNEARLSIAESGDAALALLTNQYLETRELPDVILVDMYMPGMDGLQFLSAYSNLDMAEKNKTMVIMLTNSIDPHLNAEAIRLGARGILMKPLSVGALSKLIMLMQAGASAN